MGGMPLQEHAQSAAQRFSGSGSYKTMLHQFKIIVEKHPDGYIAYPLGIKGVVVGEGDTYEEAVVDVKSAIRQHVETFGKDVLEEGSIPEVLVAEAGINF